MFQRGEDLRFTLKTQEAIGVFGKMIRQQLQRHIALELRIVRAEDDPHPSFT